MTTVRSPTAVGTMDRRDDADRTRMIHTRLRGGTGDLVLWGLAAVALVAVRAAFAVATFPTVRGRSLWLASWLGRVLPGSPAPRRVVRAVETADARLPGSRTCLMRSLAAESLLRLHGYAPDHRIGVDRDPDGEFAAHSWLEWDGEVIIGDLEDLSSFEPLPPLDEYEGEPPRTQS